MHIPHLILCFTRCRALDLKVIVLKRNFTVIFDLDGTLIDSQASILMSIEAALEAVGLESVVPLSEELIGPPLLETLSVICGTSDPTKISTVAAKFKEIYDAEGYRKSLPYEGVDELLGWLKAEGYRVCLVTNKRKIPTDKILDYFEWRQFFSHVYTIDSAGLPFKNKTEAIATFLRESEINPALAIYVGDRHDDYEAAINNEMQCLLVQWGYGLDNQASLRYTEINTIEDLMSIIQKLQ